MPGIWSALFYCTSVILKAGKHCYFNILFVWENSIPTLNRLPLKHLIFPPAALKVKSSFSQCVKSLSEKSIYLPPDFWYPNNTIKNSVVFYTAGCGFLRNFPIALRWAGFTAIFNTACSSRFPAVILPIITGSPAVSPPQWEEQPEQLWPCSFQPGGDIWRARSRWSSMLPDIFHIRPMRIEPVSPPICCFAVFLEQIQ